MALRPHGSLDFLTRHLVGRDIPGHCCCTEQDDRIDDKVHGGQVQVCRPFRCHNGVDGHVRRERQGDDDPEDNTKNAEDDDLEPVIGHENFLIHANRLEDPDLLAAVECLDRYDNEQDDRRDDDTDNQGYRVDDGKALEQLPYTFTQQVRHGLDSSGHSHTIREELVLDELLGIPGFRSHRDVISLVERLAFHLFHIGPGHKRCIVNRTPAGQIDPLDPVVFRVPVAILDRDRVPDSYPAQRRLEFIFLADGSITGYRFPDNDLPGISFPEITSGNHFCVDRGYFLLIRGRNGTPGNTEGSLPVLEGRPL